MIVNSVEFCNPGSYEFVFVDLCPIQILLRPNCGF
jgi:hypothetical protein